jgi:metallo-beta-lactamase class B
VIANVEALGFDPRRIKLLLGSQAHEDHAGAFAAIKKRAGALMLASRADAALLERGGRGDFHFGDRLTFPPVKVDRIVGDGERVTLGDVTITAHLTPGHTKGCTTWTMNARDKGRSYAALFVCGPTVPGYRLTGNRFYPGIVRDYERSFATWRRLPCQLFLGAHGSYFGLERKRGLMCEGRPNPFVDPAGCGAFLAQAEEAFRDQVRQERAGAGPAR